MPYKCLGCKRTFLPIQLQPFLDDMNVEAEVAAALAERKYSPISDPYIFVELEVVVIAVERVTCPRCKRGTISNVRLEVELFFIPNAKGKFVKIKKVESIKVVSHNATLGIRGGTISDYEREMHAGMSSEEDM